MKPSLVVDEMFPEGTGLYNERRNLRSRYDRFDRFDRHDHYDRHDRYDRFDRSDRMPVGSNKVIVELLADEKAVHADFYNDFDDLFDDEDLD